MVESGNSTKGSNYFAWGFKRNVFFCNWLGSITSACFRFHFSFRLSATIDILRMFISRKCYSAVTQDNVIWSHIVLNYRNFLHRSYLLGNFCLNPPYFFNLKDEQIYRKYISKLMERKLCLTLMQRQLCLLRSWLSENNKKASNVSHFLIEFQCHS